jgi:hypothetical protein
MMQLEDYFDFLAPDDIRLKGTRVGIETILTERNKRLPEIAESLFKVGDKTDFKRLLIPCASYLDAAYRMCGLLARLYPKQATSIAAVILPETPGSQLQLDISEPVLHDLEDKPQKKQWWKFWK